MEFSHIAEYDQATGHIVFTPTASTKKIFAVFALMVIIMFAMPSSIIQSAGFLLSLALLFMANNSFGEVRVEQNGGRAFKKPFLKFIPSLGGQYTDLPTGAIQLVSAPGGLGKNSNVDFFGMVPWFHSKKITYVKVGDSQFMLGNVDLTKLTDVPVKVE